MAQFRKNSPYKKSAGKSPTSKKEGIKRKGSRGRLLIAFLVMVAIGATVGISIYWNQVKPFQKPIIVIGDDTVTAGYFIKRCRVDPTASSDPIIMLQTLTNELLIKRGAPRYGIEVTPEDIDQALREIARGKSETISDSEFKEWYRQQLNETEFSDAEFREFVHIDLLAQRLHEYLAARVPNVTEQVHLHMIVLQEYEEALEIKERIDAGEDFADVAREVSIHEESRENGGDVGWFPYGALSDSVSWIASNLEMGDVSDPLRTSETTYTVFMVSERAAAREVDEENLAILKARVLEDWLSAESKSRKVEFRGLFEKKGFDSETYAWIQWQIARR